MSERKNSKSRLIISLNVPAQTAPKSQNTVFKSTKRCPFDLPSLQQSIPDNLKAVAWLILLVTSIFYILINI